LELPHWHFRQETIGLAVSGQSGFGFVVVTDDANERKTAMELLGAACE